MSEFQYYEFAALDRPLTAQQRGELRALSTRAEITATSFTNEYHWGNFKGDPHKLMEKYFDAFVYFANWGTRWCMLRIPREVADVKRWKEFAVPDALQIKVKDKHVIVEFLAEDEPGEYEINYEQTLAPLIPARAELMNGDLGPLYVGWLCAVSRGIVEPDEVEPCDPAQLPPASAGTVALASFLGVPENLVEAAYEPARGGGQVVNDPKKFASWIREMPAKEKDRHLVRLLSEPSEAVRAGLLKQFRDQTRESRNGRPPTHPRMADALLSLADRRVSHEILADELKLQDRPRRRR